MVDGGFVGAELQAERVQAGQLVVQAGLHAGGVKGKQFSFEKKNQKTFASASSLSELSRNPEILEYCVSEASSFEIAGIILGEMFMIVVQKA